MAYTNKTINNPVNKQSIRFLQTAKDSHGVMLEMESTYQPYSLEPSSHYHPYQSEDFEVMEGELTIRTGNEIKKMKRGERIHIPANMPHAMWNASADTTVINWKVFPAMDTEYLLETFAGLASDGKVNKKGMLPLLKVAPVAKKYAQVFRLCKPPYMVQKILFAILTPFSYIAGYKSTYKKYID